MYQNGKKIVGYSKKCVHKNKQKKKHLKMYSYGTGVLPYKTWEDFKCKYHVNHIYCNDSHLEYWHYYNMSSWRKEARKQTNRRIRRKYKISCNNIPDKFDYMDVYYDYVNLDMDYADMPLIKEKGSYRREFDYMWYIY